MRNRHQSRVRVRISKGKHYDEAKGCLRDSGSLFRSRGGGHVSDRYVWFYDFEGGRVRGHVCLRFRLRARPRQRPHAFSRGLQATVRHIYCPAASAAGDSVRYEPGFQLPLTRHVSFIHPDRGLKAAAKCKWPLTRPRVITWASIKSTARLPPSLPRDQLLLHTGDVRSLRKKAGCPRPRRFRKIHLALLLIDVAEMFVDRT